MSDAPTSPTGLGRVTRELALRIHRQMPAVFRVATFGLSGTVSRNLPFMQYPITLVDKWKTPELPHVWKDWAGDEEGVILTIWNAAWLRWFAIPEEIVDPKYAELREFLMNAKFRRWGYIPVDAEALDGALHDSQRPILERFDRILAYTDFGAKVIEKTLAPKSESDPQYKIEHLPHGTDKAIFYPRSRRSARARFIREALKKPAVIASNIFLIGVVATNTMRKDWPLAFEVCKEIKRRGIKVGVWAHTDKLQKDWDLLYLCDHAGMSDAVMFSDSDLSDEHLALGYAACNVTLGIGAGEGWGLPLAESLAMGIPCIHCDYAGGAEIVPESMRVKPIGWYYDGLYMNRRPILDPRDVADTIGMNQIISDIPASLLPAKYYWEECWTEWADWLEAGL